MQKYLGRAKLNAPKHIYQVAEKAYRNLLLTGGCQGIIVSGVSGAGKTEGGKHILQFLCWRAAQATQRRSSSGGGGLAAGRQLSSSLLDDTRVTPLSRAILQSSAVCESFCNACTSNNHNSSRFGKFIRLLIDDNGAVAGASVDAYLLEKSRLVHQCAGERSFHIFYQLLADPARRAQYGLECGSSALGAAAGEEPALAYSYLSRSGRTAICSVDDAAEWEATQLGLEAIGLTEFERDAVSRLLAGLLQLGNVGFVSDDQLEEAGVGADGSRVSDDSYAALRAVAELWGSRPRDAERALTSRGMMTGRGSSYSIGLTPEEAGHGRDALAKAAYHALFQWLIRRLNEQLRWSSTTASSRQPSSPRAEASRPDRRASTSASATRSSTGAG